MLEALTARLSILTKSSEVTKFVPTVEQRIYFDEIERQLKHGDPVRVILLKARQVGVSTATEAFMYVWSFINPNTRGMVIADDADNAQGLLGMTNLFWETDPFARMYRTKYQARNTLAWVETASSIRTDTAGKQTAGRSKTIRMLHASEVAFWDNPEVVMTGLAQTIPTLPGTFIALESTANGVGNYFYNQWQAAMIGETRFVPLFFPWWIHAQYRGSKVGIAPRPLGDLDESERALVAMFKTGLQIRDKNFTLPESEWDDALAWRRYEALPNLCQNDEKKLRQEYPSYPEEAFIATGTNVFPIQHLAKCFKPKEGRTGRLHRNGNVVEFQADIAGPLIIYSWPSPDTDYGMYSIGGDATNTTRGDFACAQVINRRTLEQVAVWRGRMDPGNFGQELAKLGRYYNMALLAPENEGPGFATIGALMMLDYPNMYQSQMPDNLPGRFTGKFGWSSSYVTKEVAIGWLLKLVVDHAITIHDRRTFAEMRDFVTLTGGGYGPASGEQGHDDLVDALAIGVTASILSGPIPAYGSATEAGPKSAPWENWTDQAGVKAINS